MQTTLWPPDGAPLSQTHSWPNNCGCTTPLRRCPIAHRDSPVALNSACALCNKASHFGTFAALAFFLAALFFLADFPMAGCPAIPDLHRRRKKSDGCQKETANAHFGETTTDMQTKNIAPGHHIVRSLELPFQTASSLNCTNKCTSATVCVDVDAPRC